jgi:hypothetical protein
MPWDCHGNKYVDDSAARHIAVTSHLPHTGYNAQGQPDPDGKFPHPLKFSRATPKQQDHCYLRLMHPVTGVSPTPEELTTDRDKCWGPNIRVIWLARGAMVHDNGNRGATKGHRAAETVNQSVQRVGQSLPVAQHSRRPLHADALAAQQTRLDEKLAAWKARRV